MWRAAISVGLALGLAAALVVRFFVYPPTGQVREVDAVVVLAGDSSARLPVATRLARGGPAVLVISVADGEENAAARRLCEVPGALTVLCFEPEPSETRGEARALGRLVDEHGWTRIAVVTNSYHLTRAGLLIRRCTDVEVQMVDARAPMPVQRWIRAVVREVGGIATTAVDRDC
jgi:uncharacterized SAM-binding protein YcdF (DUF218 family)